MTDAKIIARGKYQKKLERAHRAGKFGKFKEAEQIYREFIAEYPNDDQVLFNLGVLVQRRADSPAERVEAIDWYQKCIAAPGDVSVKSNAANNCGLIMGKINRIEEASIFFHLAIQMNPQNAAAHINFGDVLRHNGDYEAANKEFIEVLRLDPDSAAAKFSAGMIALMLGDLKRGFELYESRFDVDSFPTKKFETDKPLWTGEDLNGKTLLVTEEQGFGDGFMFCRYFREIKKRWPESKVWFRGGVLYKTIAEGMDGLDLFMDVQSVPMSLYDFHCPLISLPHRFGTTLETIPSEAPYIRVAMDGRYMHGPAEPYRKRIGLCWAGSPRHGKDAFRSLSPEEFQPLINAHPEIQFYSLQCGPRADECARLKNVIDLAPTITDWADTAQAILQLDLVISVDTAVVHLAGALDKPCWMLCPFSPDWRWLLKREDSPWYRKLKLFRQEEPNDWRYPLLRISEELSCFKS